MLWPGDEFVVYIVQACNFGHIIYYFEYEVAWLNHYTYYIVRVGRDGTAAKASIFYNGHDVSTN